MALLVCESLALQEASMALAEALLRCERKRFSFFVILSEAEGSPPVTRIIKKKSSERG